MTWERRDGKSTFLFSWETERITFYLGRILSLLDSLLKKIRLVTVTFIIDISTVHRTLALPQTPVGPLYWILVGRDVGVMMGVRETIEDSVFFVKFVVEQFGKGFVGGRRNRNQHWRSLYSLYRQRVTLHKTINPGVKGKSERGLREKGNLV